MSDCSASASVWERARRFREGKEAEKQARRIEHERLNHCYCAIEALKNATHAMRCARQRCADVIARRKIPQVRFRPNSPLVCHC